MNIALVICDCREKEHRRVASKDSSQKVFLDGWLNRLNDLRTIIKQYKEKKNHYDGTKPRLHNFPKGLSDDKEVGRGIF